MHPLLFTGCFMFAVTLLAIGVIYSHIHWLLKAALIALSLGFSVLLYVAYVNSQGYAARIMPPPMFRFLYAFVQDPMPDDPGQIYLWILDDGQPRAIRMPYSSDLRKLVGEAKRRIHEGQLVYLGIGTDKGKSGEAGSGKNQHKSSVGSNTVPYAIEGEEELVFKQPPDTLPQKETQ